MSVATGAPAGCSDTAADPTACFHCGLPVPPGVEFTVDIEGSRRPMCCAGCRAVAEAIVAGGHASYYRFRTRQPATPGAAEVPEFLRRARVYDDPAVQERFVRESGAGAREASLIIEGIACPACIWLNERHLRALPGVLDAQVNFTTHRARVRFDPAHLRLSDILAAVARIGYRAHPYDPARQEQLLGAERRAHLKRIGVAGVLGMQVMMIAFALYFGAWSGIEPGLGELLRWVSLLLAVPVLAYAARPFFAGAWRDLRLGRTGMDVPVTLGLGVAFAGSAWATWTGSGEVYYESVVMFVFLLLVARYFEFVARARSVQLCEALVHPLPEAATRLVPGGAGTREEVIPAAELRPGDRVRVRPGEHVPADGRVCAGRSSVDQSCLTGESRPLAREPGESLVGGSVNVESPLEMVVERVGADTVLSTLLELSERARAEKPRAAALAERVAGWFVSAVLVLAAGVALYWWRADPAHWLPITVSVLVITCPCALSLATPTAISAATGTLTRRGLIATRAHALETLARATHVVFDKTGTLTAGEPSVVDVRPAPGRERRACLALAAALERSSEHPVARALVAAAGTAAAPEASAVTAVPGGGLHGHIAGRWHCIGTPRFVAEMTGLAPDPAFLGDPVADGRTVVILADEAQVIAAFALADRPRAGARALVEGLGRMGLEVRLLTGDDAAPARALAAAVGIDRVAFALSPGDKLARVRALQREGAVVAMVGDGVNDAPVLGAADVSVAMGDGTRVARASADLILMTGALPSLLPALATARRAARVVRQNLAWAVGYNVVALSAAVGGQVAPWAAALGMSASSMVVVANALRLTRDAEPGPQTGVAAGERA